MKQISELQAGRYRKLAELAKEIEGNLQSLALRIMESDIPDKSKINALDWVKRAETFRGLSYFLTPQTEWTGGDSTDPKNFKITEPHIAK